jgi:hypothetical protein
LVEQVQGVLFGSGYQVSLNRLMGYNELKSEVMRAAQTLRIPQGG